MKILGIETSCDDTAVSLVEVKGEKFKIIKNLVSSQIKIHKKYGGVVPEVAAREHIQNIIPVLDLVIKDPKEIDLIAVTSGPGLITSLLVGVETAKNLAYAWNKPLIGINHLEGHIYSNWLKPPAPKFPALILIVSGGHTEIALMDPVKKSSISYGVKSHGQYKLIGQTRDDAAGEAFDKVAKLLKLGYPGGPVIEKMAKRGNPKAFNLPRPMIDHKNFDFSFAGLKTAVLYEIKRSGRDFNRADVVADLCASFQQAAVDVLVEKAVRAAKKFKPKTVMLAGGVAANSLLRKTLARKVKQTLPKTEYRTPNLKLCTDNATMIALAGYFHFKKNRLTPWQGTFRESVPPWSKLKANPNLELIQS